MSSGMLFREVAAGSADGEFGAPRTNRKGSIGRNRERSCGYTSW